MVDLSRKAEGGIEISGKRSKKEANKLGMDGGNKSVSFERRESRRVVRQERDKPSDDGRGCGSAAEARVTGEESESDGRYGPKAYKDGVA